jgi:MoxR-like ATPase
MPADTREVANVLRQGARKAIGEIDRAVSDFLLAEFKEDTLARRAAIADDIRQLAQIVSEHIAALTEAHREVDLRLQALRRLEGSNAEGQAR